MGYLTGSRHSSTTLGSDQQSLSKLAVALGLDFSRMNRDQRATIKKKLLSSLEYIIKQALKTGRAVERWDAKTKRTVVDWSDDVVQEVQSIKASGSGASRTVQSAMGLFEETETPPDNNSPPRTPAGTQSTRTNTPQTRERPGPETIVLSDDEGDFAPIDMNRSCEMDWERTDSTSNTMGRAGIAQIDEAMRQSIQDQQNWSQIYQTYQHPAAPPPFPRWSDHAAPQVPRGVQPVSSGPPPTMLPRLQEQILGIYRSPPTHNQHQQPQPQQQQCQQPQHQQAFQEPRSEIPPPDPMAVDPTLEHQATLDEIEKRKSMLERYDMSLNNTAQSIDNKVHQVMAQLEEINRKHAQVVKEREEWEKERIEQATKVDEARIEEWRIRAATIDSLEHERQREQEKEKQQQQELDRKALEEKRSQAAELQRTLEEQARALEDGRKEVMRQQEELKRQQSLNREARKKAYDEGVAHEEKLVAMREKWQKKLDEREDAFRLEAERQQERHRESLEPQPSLPANVVQSSVQGDSVHSPPRSDALPLFRQESGQGAPLLGHRGWANNQGSLFGAGQSPPHPEAPSTEAGQDPLLPYIDRLAGLMSTSGIDDSEPDTAEAVVEPEAEAVESIGVMANPTNTFSIPYETDEESDDSGVDDDGEKDANDSEGESESDGDGDNDDGASTPRASPSTQQRSFRNSQESEPEFGYRSTSRSVSRPRVVTRMQHQHQHRSWAGLDNHPLPEGHPPTFAQSPALEASGQDGDQGYRLARPVPYASGHGRGAWWDNSGLPLPLPSPRTPVAGTRWPTSPAPLSPRISRTSWPAELMTRPVVAVDQVGGRDTAGDEDQVFGMNSTAAVLERGLSNEQVDLRREALDELVEIACQNMARPSEAEMDKLVEKQQRIDMRLEAGSCVLHNLLLRNLPGRDGGGEL
ncbi:hypothetical protein F66182_7563 [Fusarium sp. NRRL 66182]|nr:hypothetical protein F66182_7563 [Fusarium sp. NRRL 66182]